jgi:hypothetical protein
MLAVDSHGNVTGYYREQQGDRGVKTCSFYLAGHGTGAEIPVVTWSDRTLQGTLKAHNDSVRLTVENGREHPGCGLVLLPQITKGLELDRVADARWSELRRITTPKSYFHSAPDPSRVLKAFVVSGDVVGVIGQKGEWLEVEYRGRTSTTRGWILDKTTSKLTPPDR